MSTAYSKAELDAMARAMQQRQPPQMTSDQLFRALKMNSFAILGDGRGVVARFRTDEGSVCNFAFNPFVARYLALAIIDVARVTAWTINGETLHPNAVARGFRKPNPNAETEWEKRFKDDSVIAPEVGTFDKSPKVLAINGQGSPEEFAVSFVLDRGKTANVRMNPLVAWQLSRAITEIALEAVWWGGDDNMIPGQGQN